MIDREMKLKNQQAHEDLKQQEQSIDLNKDSVQMEIKKTVFRGRKRYGKPRRFKLIE